MRPRSSNHLYVHILRGRSRTLCDERWAARWFEDGSLCPFTWGESPSDVRDWLSDNGVNPSEAASFVRKCVRRRACEMRMLGTWNLIRGACSAAASIVWAICGWYVLHWLAPPPAGLYLGRLLGLVFSPTLFLGVYACYELWLAFDRLLFGANADGPVTDIED